MFGLSGEHLLIIVVILLIFGPRKLPQLGAALGKATRNFKEQINGILEPSYRSLGEAKLPNEAASASRTADSAAGTKS